MLDEQCAHCLQYAIEWARTSHTFPFLNCFFFSTIRFSRMFRSRSNFLFRPNVFKASRKKPFKFLAKIKFSKWLIEAVTGCNCFWLTKSLKMRLTDLQMTRHCFSFPHSLSLWKWNDDDRQWNLAVIQWTSGYIWRTRKKCANHYGLIMKLAGDIPKIYTIYFCPFRNFFRLSFFFLQNSLVWRLQTLVIKWGRK